MERILQNSDYTNLMFFALALLNYCMNINFQKSKDDYIVIDCLKLIRDYTVVKKDKTAQYQ